MPRGSHDPQCFRRSSPAPCPAISAAAPGLLFQQSAEDFRILGKRSGEDDPVGKQQAAQIGCDAQHFPERILDGGMSAISSRLRSAAISFRCSAGSEPVRATQARSPKVPPRFPDNPCCHRCIAASSIAETPMADFAEPAAVVIDHAIIGVIRRANAVSPSATAGHFRPGPTLHANGSRQARHRDCAQVLRGS